MSFRALRSRILLFAALCVVLGFGIGYAGLPESVGLGTALAVGLVGGVGTIWYYRRLERAGRLDERHEVIQSQASNVALAALLVTMSIAGIVELLTPVDLPRGYDLIGFVFGGVVAHEVAIEWFRRRT